MAGKLMRIEAELSDLMYTRWMMIKPKIIESGTIVFDELRDMWELRPEAITAVVHGMRKRGLPVPYTERSGPGKQFGECPQCKRNLQVWVDEKDRMWRFCECCMYEVIE